MIGDGDRMKRVWLFLVFLGLMALLMVMGTAYAQKQPKNLTILYTNNINAEIDPCPS